MVKTNQNITVYLLINAYWTNNQIQDSKILQAVTPTIHQNFLMRHYMIFKQQYFHNHEFLGMQTSISNNFVCNLNFFDVCYFLHNSAVKFFFLQREMT